MPLFWCTYLLQDKQFPLLPSRQFSHDFQHEISLINRPPAKHDQKAHSRTNGDRLEALASYKGAKKTGGQYVEIRKCWSWNHAENKFHWNILKGTTPQRNSKTKLKFQDMAWIWHAHNRERICRIQEFRAPRGSSKDAITYLPWKETLNDSFNIRRKSCIIQKPVLFLNIAPYGRLREPANFVDICPKRLLTSQNLVVWP